MVFMRVLRIGSGISRTISMSNTIKIIASIKNRNENGIRELFLGSNPHSNGDVFSRSLLERVLRILVTTNSNIEIIAATIVIIIGIYITQKY